MNHTYTTLDCCKRCLAKAPSWDSLFDNCCPICGFKGSFWYTAVRHKVKIKKGFFFDKKEYVMDDPNALATAKRLQERAKHGS